MIPTGCERPRSWRSFPKLYQSPRQNVTAAAALPNPFAFGAWTYIGRTRHLRDDFQVSADRGGGGAGMLPFTKGPKIATLTPQHRRPFEGAPSMRIFQDGRTGSIRIISRPEGELARVADDEHEASADAAAPR